MSNTTSTNVHNYRLVSQFMETVLRDATHSGVRVSAYLPYSNRYVFILKPLDTGAPVITLLDLDTDEDTTLPATVDNIMDLYTQAKMVLEA